ncbi:DUF6493 family protein [Streptomyces sp. AcH 505]|uniref:DUF7824 domain-containing protein n=1 Tax=Streptomyces sp. AcH 505 TaxID=352211 RepID=UPI0005A8AC65
MSELLDAVRAGDHESVPGLVKPLTPADRKAALAELKALRSEVRGWHWDRWRERSRVQRALLVAGAGCLTGAAAAAAWIGARDLRNGDRAPWGLADLLADRDPAWLGEVARRLAERNSTAEDDFSLIRELSERAGTPLPDTDAVVRGWADTVGDRERSLLGGLRKDTHVTAFVPRLFELAELPNGISWRTDAQDPDHWPSLLAVLAEEGVVERDMLVDACVARLLRGGRPREQVFFLNVARRLGLSPAEETAHTADWIGMAADGPSAVAGYAHGVLARIAADGALPVRSLADMTGSVLFRPEKKLVRAQLVLVGKVLRSDRGAADELLPVLADAAFGHQDTDVQERALKLVARCLADVGEESRQAVAASAALLSPVHRARAVELFGEQPAAGAGLVSYEEILPPVPLPVRLAPAPSTVAEVVEEVVVLSGGRDGDTVSFERTLDGLVRLAYQDTAALTAALRDALADRWWFKGETRIGSDSWFVRAADVGLVAAALLEKVSARTLTIVKSRWTANGKWCAHEALDGVLNARLREVASLIRTRPLPFLLATPTWESGTLDPDVLVERLREYQRLCATPAPVDFAQALLRVRRGGRPETARAAAALGTPEARRLADWLSGEGTPVPALVRDDSEKAVGSAAGGEGLVPRTRRLLAGTRERRVVEKDFPREFHWLGRSDVEVARYCYHWSGGRNTNWPAVLPENSEVLAHWLLPGVEGCAADAQRGGTWCLPVLAEIAELPGPGPSLHLALAYGLGARHPGDRLAAVDGLLILAARGGLEGKLLGERLGALVDQDSVKLNRLTDSLRTAAESGAAGTVWSVICPALPALLAPGTKRTGLGEILAVAADCVERCGAAGEAPTGLAALAARGGGSRVTAQAARLLAALGQRNDHSTPKTVKTSLN